MKLDYQKLTIYEVEAFHKELLDMTTLEGDVVLDFSDVEKIDMLAIQLLISFKKTCVSHKKSLTFENVQAGVMSSLTLSGAHTFLGA